MTDRTQDPTTEAELRREADELRQQVEALQEFKRLQRADLDAEKQAHWNTRRRLAGAIERAKRAEADRDHARAKLAGFID